MLTTFCELKTWATCIYYIARNFFLQNKRQSLDNRRQNTFPISITQTVPFVLTMQNGNDRLSYNLETIPEEGNDLPRISELIPKSPETRKREQEYLQLHESHKEYVENFVEMLIVQRNLKRICCNERYFCGNYDDFNAVNRSQAKRPTMT